MPPTSQSLLSQMRVHDQKAWSRFVSTYCPAIYTNCRKVGLQAAIAQDICQEVLLAVVNGIGGFQKVSPSDSFRGWLYRITANKISDHFRKAKKQLPAIGGSDFARYLQQFSAQSDEGPSSSSGSQPSSNGDLPVGEPLLPAAKVEYRMALETLRPTFDETTWKAFEGMAVHGRTAKEVGAELGMDPHAVRQAKYRVLKRFRDQYGEILDL
ncbi:MAG: sigma-70 family RNA polymerase sigma factor [Planctomycetales bacterium]|nr:sigma-70 family RNA polymerase sigma factor [Planctomycetales bacterium]